MVVVDDKRAFRPGRFVLVGTMDDEPVDGYARPGECVLGWVMPVIEYAAAVRVAEAVNAVNATHDGVTLVYDAARDAFVYDDRVWTGADEPAVYAGYDVAVAPDGQVQHVYPIGWDAWTWDRWESRP